MRIPLKTKFGNEVILSEEEEVTFSEMNWNTMTYGTEYESKPFDQIFYVDEGIVVVTINGTDFEWSYGKSFKIKAKSMCSIRSRSIPTRVFKLAFGRKKYESFEPK